MTSDDVHIEKILGFIKEYHNETRFIESIKLCEALIDIVPKNAEVFHLLSKAYYNLRDAPKALQQIEHAIKNNPKQPNFHNFHGEILNQLGFTKEAENAFRKALTLDREMTKALINLGTILAGRDKLKPAINALDKAFQLEPENIYAIIALAETKQKAGHMIDALELNAYATKVSPLFEVAWNNLATIHMDLEQWKEALSALKKSLILAPHHCGSWGNLAFVYMNFGSLSLSKRYFNFAITIQPTFSNAYCGLAEAYFIENDLTKAIEYSQTAIKIAPEDNHYKSRLALQLLSIGRISEGWKMRDARLMLKDKIDHRQRPPRWNGSSLKGKTLLITAEEGIGDELLFASCFNDAIADSDKCFIECDARLVDLFERSFPSAVIGATERTGSRFKPVQSYNWLPKTSTVDLSIEGGSLFRYYRTNLESFSTQTPYLIADVGLQEFWKNRLNSLGPGLTVGFCWRSKFYDGIRNHHYTTLQEWVDVFDTPNCNFISLQYGKDWQQEIDEAPTIIRNKITVFEEADLSDDFEAICAIISNLDLVICPSSTVAWVGGALSIPTWVTHLKPNWTQLGTEKFPGFPSMQSFSKKFYEPWTVCFDPIKKQLSDAVQAFSDKKIQ